MTVAIYESFKIILFLMRACNVVECGSIQFAI